MDEWQETALSEAIDIIGGGTPKTTISAFWSGDIPWLSVADFNTGRKYVYTTEKNITQLGLEKSSTKLLKKGDIIISARGTVGVISMLGGNMAFNQSCYGIREKVDLSDGNYIYYLLKDTVDNLQKISHGGVFDTITRDTFKEIDILLPPLPEQKAIASVLSYLDDKIDLLHNQNKTLEAMAETLFRQWFVEEADEGWEDGCLGDLASFHNGKKRPDETIGGGVPIYGGNGILGYANLSNYDGTTIIVGRVGAYCGSLYIEHSPVWVSDNALVARSKQSKHSTFLFNLLKSFELNGMAEGSSHPLLTQTLLKAIPLPLPPDELIESYILEADLWLEKIEHNKSKIQTLEKLRDTLLPKLMSGEVRVEYEH